MNPVTPEERIEKLLVDELTQNGVLFFSATPQLIRTKLGLNYKDYIEGKTLQAWILSNPKFERDRDNPAYQFRLRESALPKSGETLDTPDAEKPKKTDIPTKTGSDAEVRQMHAFAYMNMWYQNEKKLRLQYEIAEKYSNEFRDTIAYHMSEAMMGFGEGILSSPESGEELAFDSGLKSSRGNPIYCVLWPNPRSGERQSYALKGFCCPEEGAEEGVGQWLINRYDPGTAAVGPDLSELRRRLAEAFALREELSDDLTRYSESVAKGTRPDVGLRDKIQEYDVVWEEISTLSGRCLPELERESLQLDFLAGQLEQGNLLTDKLREAAELFEQLTNAVESVYRVNNLRSAECLRVLEQDQKVISSLSETIPPDENYEEAERILKPYQALLAVMSADTVDEAGDDNIDLAVAHFPGISYRFAARALVRSDQSEYEPLLKAEDIHKILEQCRFFQTEQMSARQVHCEETSCDVAWPDHAEEWRNIDPKRWLTLLAQLLPRLEQGEAVFGPSDSSTVRLAEPEPERCGWSYSDNDNGSQGRDVWSLFSKSDELTPYAIGVRLLLSDNSHEDLAERYLLLGLRYDSSRCVRALLRLYREENRSDEFLDLWKLSAEMENRKDLDYAEDYLYFLCLKDKETGVDWKLLEDGLDENPALRTNPRMKAFLQEKLADLPDVCGAYAMWCGAAAGTRNEFEEAVAANALSKFSTLVDNAESMSGMGYDETSQTSIRNILLRGNLPAGADPVSRAMRVKAVQGNRNRTAESMLWESVNSARVRFALFDLYAEEKDAASLCWLVQHFSMDMETDPVRLPVYAKCLLTERKLQQLDAVIRHHPSLWRCGNTVAIMAEWEREQCSVQDRFWQELYIRDEQQPFVPVCPFEEALICGDANKAMALSADDVRMLEWGYGGNLLQDIRTEITQNQAFLFGTDVTATKRIGRIQGNLHRLYEKQLYMELEHSPESAAPFIFELLYTGKYYTEASVFYEAMPCLKRDPHKAGQYLRCLMELKKYDQLLEVVQNDSFGLQEDKDLGRDVLDIVVKMRGEDAAASLRRRLGKTPGNRFEENLIQLKREELQTMLSDTVQMTELGYSQDEILSFKERYRRPFPEGMDGYSVAVRVQLFLGDDRAEPFLLDSESDPKSARMLLDIYQREKRWDDLCDLYERHQKDGIWKDNHDKNYINALSNANQSEHCSRFLDFLDQSAIDKNAPVVMWLNLRAMLISGRKAGAAFLEDRILSTHRQYMEKYARDIFNALLETGNEMDRQEALNFAGRLLEAYEDELSVGQIRSLVTLFGRLNDSQESLRCSMDYLHGSGFDEFIWLLRCLGTPDLKQFEEGNEAFVQDTICRLSGLQPAGITLQRLKLYSECVFTAGFSENDEEAVLHVLLNLWDGYLSLHPEEEEFWRFYCAEIARFVRFPRELEHALKIWSRSMDLTSPLEGHLKDLQRGQEIYSKLQSVCPGGIGPAGKDSKDSSEGLVRNLHDRIFDEWTEVLAQSETPGSAEWNQFDNFWKLAHPSDAQLSHMMEVILHGNDKSIRGTREGLSLCIYLLRTGSGWKGNGDMMDSLVDALLTLVRDETWGVNVEDSQILSDFLSLPFITLQQWQSVMDALADSEVSGQEDIRDLIYECACRNGMYAAAYQWKKRECLEIGREDERYTSCLNELLSAAEKMDEIPAGDDNDLQLLYEAVCRDCSRDSITLLRQVYNQAGKEEQTEVLSVLDEGDWEGSHPERLREWFIHMLEKKSPQWVDQYARWWGPLIRISEEDQQIESSLKFIGLKEETVEDSCRRSVTRLLMRDLSQEGRGEDSLRCFLRIETDLPDSALSCLRRIEAGHNPARMEEAAYALIAREQFIQAQELIVDGMFMHRPNAVAIGKILEKLYSEPIVRSCPELSTEHTVTSILRGILRMNETMTVYGDDLVRARWKNIGRAVDVVCASNQEHLYFDVMDRTILKGYPEKSSVVIAHLMQRGDFPEARYRLDEARQSRPDCGYLTILDQALQNVEETGGLNGRYDLLVRSIPREGNSRSLESLGKLVGYAMDHDMAGECAETMRMLYEQNPADKALANCYIQLYTAKPERLADDLEFLDKTAERYAGMVSNEFYERSVMKWAVIHCCLSAESAELNTVTIDCGNRLTSAEMNRILALENQCREFLRTDRGLDQRVEILLRAATGWWKFDRSTRLLLRGWDSLLRELMKLSQASFSSACVQAALTELPECCDAADMKRKMADLDENRFANGIRGLDMVSTVPKEHREWLAGRIDAPLDIPFLYTHLFESILENGEEEQVRRDVSILLSLQPKMTFNKYLNNDLQLRGCVEQHFPQYQNLVLKAVIDITDSSNKPEDFLDDRNYEMAAYAAEHNARKNREPSNKYRNKYEEARDRELQTLGKIMKGIQPGNQRMAYMFNMAILLCQRESWQDLPVLMKVCPKASWKVCLRCAQEMVQGKPSNILYVLSNAEFCTEHRGSAIHLRHLVSKCWFDRNFIYWMEKENHDNGRETGWGLVQKQEVIRDPQSEKLEKGIFIINIKLRNPVVLSDFRADIDAFLAEAEQEDSVYEDDSPEMEPKIDPSIRADTHELTDFREISYVRNQTEKFLELEPTEDSGNTSLIWELQKMIEGKSSDAKTKIDCYSRLIALNWNTKTDVMTLKYCVELGFLLFDEYYGRGKEEDAVVQARKILYEMAPCISNIRVTWDISDRLRVALVKSLSGYSDLYELLDDCEQPYMDDLCTAIQDDLRRTEMMAFVQKVREIRKEVAVSRLTDPEKSDKIKKCILNLNSGHFNYEMFECLNHLLNQELERLKGKAQVIVHVYNRESAQDYGHIFGKVTNVGNERIHNVRMELKLDNVLYRRYWLQLLEGNSMVPFDLRFEAAEDETFVHYDISIVYTTASGQEELLTSAAKGEITILGEEREYSYNLYKVDTPVDEADYTERDTIQRTLNMYFGPNIDFSKFPNLAIYGMKRMGKTSVLRYLRRMLARRESDVVCVADSSGEGAAGTIFSRTYSMLIQQVMRNIGEHPENLPAGTTEWDRFRCKWMALDPAIKEYGSAVHWSSGKEQWLPYLNADNETWEWLADFYSEISDLLKSSGLVVIVDEIENLYRDNAAGVASSKSGNEDSTAHESGTDLVKAGGDVSLWDMLSRITQKENSRVRFVLCGSDYFTNKAMAGDNLTQFFQRICKLCIGRMTFPELQQTMIALDGVHYLQDSIDYLWSLAGGLPWHSKLVGNAIIQNKLNREEATRAVIYPSDIASGIEEIMSNDNVSSDNNFGLIALSDDERLVLTILTQKLTTAASVVGENELRKEFSGHTTGEEELKLLRLDRALKMLLTGREMLCKVKGKEGTGYRFGCELYRLYNRKEKLRLFVTQRADETV